MAAGNNRPQRAGDGTHDQESKANSTALGELQSVDGYMNIALEKCEEHVNGVKKRSYGDAFIRGNNGTSLRPSYAH